MSALEWFCIGEVSVIQTSVRIVEVVVLRRILIGEFPILEREMVVLETSPY